MSKKTGSNAASLWLLGAVAVFAGLLIADANPIVGVLTIGVGFVLLIAGRGSWGAWNGRGGVVRPTSQATAFSAPPLPDTVLVKCDFCSTVQPFREKCVHCGAPLPRP